MQKSLVLLMSTFAAVGCVSRYVIVPVAGDEVGTASANGLVMHADPDAWGGRPPELTRYLLPIRLEIQNEGTREVRVNYADFALVDSNNFRYAAINPYTLESVPESAAETGARGAGAQAEPLAGDWSGFDSLAEAEDEELGTPAGPQASPWQARVERVDRAEAPRAVRGRAADRVHRHDFYVHPRYRFYFGYHDPWPYYYDWPPYYGTYVYSWGGPYVYYPGPPSTDVLSMGLPEGVVNAGGTVSGFIYFQNAAARGPTGLRLVWSPRTPAGEPLPRLSVPFVMVRARDAR